MQVNLSGTTIFLFIFTLYLKTALPLTYILKFIALIYLSSAAFYCSGQSFSNVTGGIIPDNNTLTFYPVTVTGLGTVIDSVNFGIISVCINLNHNYDANLDIYIKSPDGTVVKLVNNRGANGKNFTNCCFSESGSIPVAQGIAPFTGNFIPEETINALNNLQNPNGIWSLGIHDEVLFNSGTLLNFTISFGNNPPKTPETSVCSVTNGKGCKCPDGTQNCDLLPDITNSEKIIQQNLIEFNGYIRIGVGTPNIGYGPIEIRGTNNCYCDTIKVPCSTVLCPNGSNPKQEVYQRIYHKDSSSITYIDRAAGFMQYHPAHGHVHLDDWTINSLRLNGPNANPLTWPLLGTDKKVSFCLVNLSDCNAIPGACKDKNGNILNYSNVGNPGMGVISGCGTDQGIYPGYIDIYYPGYEGQDIFFGNICNGWYNIVSVTDPKNLITESDKTNNIAVVPVFLSQQAGDCCTADFIADTLAGVAPLKVSFTDKTMPLSSSWRWEFGDGDSASVAYPSHTYVKPGVYDVTLKTTAKGTNCNSVALKRKLITVLPNGGNNNPYNIIAYPVPFKNSLKVYYQTKKIQSINIKIFDAAGRMLLFVSKKNILPGQQAEEFNTSGFAGGIYFIRMCIDEEWKVIKVIK
jgi:PKD repeat protein/subtilisin-like proprotein convertase family protein